MGSRTLRRVSCAILQILKLSYFYVAVFKASFENNTEDYHISMISD